MSTDTLSLEDLRGDPRRLRKERTVRIVLLGAALMSIAISAAIMAFCLLHGRAV